MNTTELPQYLQVVDALAPVLHGLPGKLIAIDGRLGSGKTTLGRYLAWRFNVSLVETDLFRGPGDTLAYRLDEINRVIDARLKRSRPVIVECAVVLRLMAELKRKPHFVIYVSNANSTDTEHFADEIVAYEARYQPKTKANLTIEVDV
jgi:adenylate kinase family enzyme